MKRNPKVEKPSLSVDPVKEKTFSELCADALEMAKQQLERSKEALVLAKERGIVVDALYDNLKRQIKEKKSLEKILREDEEEARRVKRIIYPNFPDQEWRAYSYQELSELCREWGNDPKYAIRAAFIMSGIKLCKADIDFYHGGDFTKAKFYPTELCWVNFTIIINGKPLTDRQREINNLQNLTEYSCTNPKQLIPASSSMWRRRLFVFTQIHEN